MFEEYFMEYELACLKNEHAFESVQELFNVAIANLSILNKEGYFSESAFENEVVTESGKVLDSLVKFFDNLIESIKKLVTDVMDAVRVKIQQKKVNEKLKYVKQTLANKKSAKVNAGKVKYFDTARFLKAQKKYIDAYVSGIKKLYSKKYEDVYEFDKAVEKLNNDLDKLAEELYLFNDEKWIIETNINSAIEYTEKELASQKSVVDAFKKAWIGAVEESKKASKENTYASIKSMTSKFSNKCASAFKKITNSPITKVADIGTAVSVIAAAQYKSGYSFGYNSAKEIFKGDN